MLDCQVAIPSAAPWISIPAAKLHLLCIRGGVHVEIVGFRRFTELLSAELLLHGIKWYFDVGKNPCANRLWVNWHAPTPRYTYCVCIDKWTYVHDKNVTKFPWGMQLCRACWPANRLLMKTKDQHFQQEHHRMYTDFPRSCESRLSGAESTPISHKHLQT